VSLTEAQQRRLMDLEREKELLLAEHDRHTSRMMTELHDTDGEANLLAVTELALDSLRNGVERIGKNREALRRVNNMIRELSKAAG
jgi:hypothetical protein